MLSRKTIALVAGVFTCVGLLLAWAGYKSVTQRDAEFVACSETCSAVGKKPALVRPSNTQSLKFGGFSGASKCVCV